MAIVYQHNINEETKLAIWHITETEDFFLQRVPLKRDVSHPQKRLQHLAGRYLLTHLFPDFPLSEILIADTKKPFLENEQYHFSISHCGQYAAAIASSKQRVGIDIELITPRIERIKDKFLSVQEWELAMDLWPPLNKEKTSMELLTVLWSAKEALFKWYGAGQVDFSDHMQLNGDILKHPSGSMTLPFIFQKGEPQHVDIEVDLFTPLVLAWVAS